MKRIDFDNGKITTNILQAALPMLVAQILSLLYNIVDRIYIARIPNIGTAALGAVGLSEETKKHIYDRFYRADKSRNTEGFGLGLSLVHKIIELHKGTIRVQSELGVGSIFTLSLPSDKSSQ